MDFVQIQWTCANVEEAKKIAKDLVKKKWVACANILPHIESIYIWNGKLQEDHEIKVFFKTSDIYFSRIRDYIIQHASYEVPEVSKFLIADANPDYMNWLFTQLSD